MRRMVAVLSLLLMAAPALAQSGPKAVFIDLVAEGSMRPELFTCIRRGIAQAGDVSFVGDDDPNKTHTVSVRAQPTYAGRSLTGYMASIHVTASIPAALRERLTAQLQGDERTRVLTDLRRYGAIDMSRILIRPKNIKKFCDAVAAEVETGLFDQSGRAGEPALPSGRR